MSNPNEPDQNKLSLARPGRLEIKKTVESGKVRQSFSHGRSKTVTVEVKRKRTYKADAAGQMVPVGADGRPVQVDIRLGGGGLTDGERAARERALKARQHDDQDVPTAQPEAAAVVERPSTVVEPEPAPPPPPPPPPPMSEEERELAALRQAEAEERQKADELTRRIEEEQRRRDQDEVARQAQDAAARLARAEQQRPATHRATPTSGPVAAEEEESRARRPGATAPKRPGVARKDDQRRRTGKMTVTQALDENVGQARVRSLASMRRARERERQRQRDEGGQAKFAREVIIPETITVQELANRMAERGADVVKSLMKLGIMATITQVIEADTAELLVTEFGHRAKRVAESDVELGIEGVPDEESDLLPRPPVVTIMGHVDHGKTSLLDAMRQTDVAAHEAGGITQHIGAYQVEVASGERITFLDTPGHEAFSSMRARGAKVTDIVILVVAADDSVQPQTVEALNHAKAADVPIIIAINKVDKPDANPQRVKNDLLQYSLVTEDLGGDILAVEVSATKKIGLEELIEAILLQAEVLELRANPNRAAQGAIVEAQLERGRGAVATVLVQRGTLHVGDVFVAGTQWGRVRALINDRGENLQSAEPSLPVAVLGLNSPPLAGDDLVVVENEARAREITDFRQNVARRTRAAAGARGTVEQMFSQIAAGVSQELPVVVKADVQGSVEAIVASLERLGTDEVRPRILHSGVGGISESDVTLAGASGGFVIGFNVRANPQARELAKRDGVEIRYYSIIYELVDDLRASMSSLLAPMIRERQIGNAEIREVFNITRVGKVAGCYVTDGIVKRGAGVRLLRENVVIHEGKLSTLKRFKDEVREVRDGYECGMAFEGYQDLQVGDVIECFETEEVIRTI